MQKKPTRYFYQYRGQTYTRRQLQEIAGVSKYTMRIRLKNSDGIVTEDVLKPPQISKLFLEDYDGSKISLGDFARKYGLDYNFVFYRYKRGCRNPDILRKRPFSLDRGELIA